MSETDLILATDTSVAAVATQSEKRKRWFEPDGRF
jgi:hypothetical protein